MNKKIANLIIEILGFSLLSIILFYMGRFVGQNNERTRIKTLETQRDSLAWIVKRQKQQNDSLLVLLKRKTPIQTFGDNSPAISGGGNVVITY